MPCVKRLLSSFAVYLGSKFCYTIVIFAELSVPKSTALAECSQRAVSLMLDES